MTHSVYPRASVEILTLVVWWWVEWL